MNKKIQLIFMGTNLLILAVFNLYDLHILFSNCFLPVANLKLVFCTTSFIATFQSLQLKLNAREKTLGAGEKLLRILKLIMFSKME
jgi:hypothetical protein